MARRNIKKGSEAAKNCAIVNLFLSMIKFLGWIISGSVALLADSIHSLSDLISSATAYVGLKIAQRKPTEKFPYGFYKAETISLLIISSIIIFTGTTILIESVNKFFHPNDITLPSAALTIALFSAITSFVLSKYEEKIGIEINSEALVSDAKESRMDFYTTISVFLGILLSYFGFHWAEAIVGIVISGFVIKIGITFGKNAIFDLMDVCPEPELVDKIRKIAKGVKGIKNIGNVRIRKSGPFLIGDLEIEVDGKVAAKTVEKISDDLKRKIKKKIKRFDHITITTKTTKSKKVLDQEEGINYVKDFLKKTKKKPPIIIGIAGASASGKSFFGKMLSKKLNATLINLDMFYKKNSRELATNFGNNFDHPKLMDFEYIRSVLESIKKGTKSVKIPKYSFKHGRRIGYETKNIRNVVVVEGLYTFYKDLKKYMDLKIVVESETHHLLLKRLVRDVKRSGEDMQTILDRVLHTVFPMYFLFIEPTLKDADVTVINKYNPLVDGRSGKEVTQVKVKCSPKLKEFLKDCKKIKTVTQVDTYFIKPYESELDLREFMRVREERNHTPKYSLTFKLRLPSEKLDVVRELEIPQLKVDIISHLLSLGYRVGKTIKKERTMYKKGNVQILYDRVYIKGKKKYFVEFRSSSKEDIEQLISNLKIPKSKLITKPYVRIVLEEESG
ncbi:MAG: cation diffusion facilitator family transporter [Candidatus Aenigmarchaeota archaeon]|nr:cation diffusion facilitator family transporter [Candidatus Aenigmarchaeota archaeon]